jgi:hypothetical protein
MKMKPIHESLPLMARITIKLPEDAYKIVSMLNQTLKDKNISFGLRAIGEIEYEFSIYDSDTVKLDQE